MLAKVIQFVGPALKSPVGPLPQGLMGVMTSFNGQVLNMITYQTGRWPGRAVSHKHLHRLPWGRATRTLACSLGMYQGLLERIKDRSPPGRGTSAVKSWGFE